MTEPVAYAIATADHFPHGLKCCGCGRRINPGQPYSKHPDGFIGEIPTLVLTCVYCPGLPNE